MRITKTFCLYGLCLGLGLGTVGQARALDLTLPFSAQMTTRVVTAPDSYALVTGPFAAGRLPVLDLEGSVERQVFRFPGQSLTTLQLVVPLREQLELMGYEILFECEATACGGFDFRFATEVLPAPDMYVDLTDFRYLSVRRGPQDHIGVLVSVSANAGFMQMIRVTRDPDVAGLRINTTGAEETPPTPASPEPAMPAAPLPMVDTDPAPLTLVDSLRQQGHVILSDLSFPTGSSDLSDGRYETLSALAEFLLSDPTRRIALVGHTDTVGGLSVNITLSRARAASVRQRLITAYSVPPAQLDAEGMGYLSPIAPNTTPEGREANRRVEAVLLNTD